VRIGGPSPKVGYGGSSDFGEPLPKVVVVDFWGKIGLKLAFGGVAVPLF